MRAQLFGHGAEKLGHAPCFGTQPPGWWGGSPLNTSEIWPRPSSRMCCWNAVSHRLACSRAAGLCFRTLRYAVKKGAHEPGPDCTLMVGGVARVSISAVDASIFWIAAVQRTQAIRCQKLALHDVHNRVRFLIRKQRMRQAGGESLVGPDRGIALRSVDHVEPAIPLRVPEFIRKAGASSVNPSALEQFHS
jgi:hypothetical protein